MQLTFAEPILQRFFPKKFVPKISRQEILAAIPIRNSLVEWETNDLEEVTLKVPRREDRMGHLLHRLFAAPPYKQVVLDELGSDVWQLCTGDNDVDAIVKGLAKKYKLSRREVELSLANYLRTLAQRGLIGLVQKPKAGSRQAVNTRKQTSSSIGG